MSRAMVISSEDSVDTVDDTVDSSRSEGVKADRHFQGVLWLTIHTIVAKVLQMLTLIPLTWLLEPRDLGVIGLVTAVTAFVGIIQQLGIREILIHRQQSFAYWSNPAFWFSLSVGFLGGLIMALVAFAAAHVWHNPSLKNLLLVFAVAVPFQAVGVIPEARLYCQLRFRSIALIGISLAIVQACLCIFFAWAGLGAYSFVLPLIIVSVIRTAVLWSITRIALKRTCETHLWKHLLTDSSVVFLTNLSYIVVSQGDYLVLGMIVSSEALGHYFLAFNLAMAPLHLFALNLNSVLFPSLSSLQNNPSRQIEICQRVSRMLALVVTPLSFLQVLIADPVIRLCFGPEWHPIIPLVQILSLGMSLRCIGWPSISLLQAQGRFVARLTLAVVWAAVLLLAVALGAGFDGAWGGALCVSVIYTIIGPVTLYVTLRPSGTSMRQVAVICLRPLMAACAIALPVFAISRLLEAQPLITQVAIILASACCLFIPVVHFADSSSTDELIRRIFPAFHSRFLHRVA